MILKRYTGVRCPECRVEFGLPERITEEEPTLTCPVCDEEVDTDEALKAFAGKDTDHPETEDYEDDGPDPELDDPDEAWPDDDEGGDDREEDHWPL